MIKNMPITNWEMNEPAQMRPRYVYEFIGINGLPPNLRGKAETDVACYEPTPTPRTLTADALAPIELGDRIEHHGFVFEIRSIDGHRFRAVEVITL